MALAEGFEQILPSRVRTGNGRVVAPQAITVDEVQSPTIHSPQPTTSRLLLPTTPAKEYPIRSVSPDLVPDRMASRLPEGFARRLTPNPEQQEKKQNGAPTPRPTIPSAVRVEC